MAREFDLVALAAIDLLTDAAPPGTLRASVAAVIEFLVTALSTTAAAA